MKRGSLTLMEMGNGCYRTVFKTRHGRLVYFQLQITKDNEMVIQACHYLDRPERCRPRKLITFRFDRSALLQVVARELDRNFYGVEFIADGREYDYNAFVSHCLRQFHTKYKFLIMVGEGDSVNGLPAILKTRFKNRIHRSIYFEVRHYKENRGVVADCHYFDRKYRQEDRTVTPPTLRAVFFEYSRTAVIRLVNSELNADFTHLLIVTDGSIDIANKLPLCGNL